MIWYIVMIIVFVVFLLLLTLRLLIARTIKRRSVENTHNDHKFYYDHLVKSERQARRKKQKNYLFETNFLDGQVITNYIITREKRKNQIVLKYVEGLRDVNFQIFCYDKNVKLIQVIDMAYNELPNYSRIIKLTSKTEHINFVEGKKGLDIQAINKQKYSTLLLLLDSTIMFTFIMSLSYLVGLLLVGNQIIKYFNSLNIVIVTALALIFIIINFVMIKMIFSKRDQGLVVWEEFS